MTGTPAQSLSTLSDYVGGLAESQRQRLDQMQELAASIAGVQAHLKALEQDNARLMSDLKASQEREERLKVVLLGEQAAREAMVTTHADEIEQMEAKHRYDLEQASARAMAGLDEIKQKSAEAIEGIRAEARSAIDAACEETLAMRSAYEKIVAENDRLNEGMDLLIRVVEGTAKDAYDESNAITEMISALDTRLPDAGADRTQGPDLSFLRRRNAIDGAVEQNRAA